MLEITNYYTNYFNFYIPYALLKDNSDFFIHYSLNKYFKETIRHIITMWET